MESEPRVEIEQAMDAATMGLMVLGLRAFIEPEKYPSNPMTDRALQLFKTTYMNGEGFDIDAGLYGVAYPPKTDYTK